jgi:hypothetical protein
MRVYYECRPIMSQAMHKIRKALIDRAPDGIEFVLEPRLADVQFIEAIGFDATSEPVAPAHVYLQFCLASAGGSREQWIDAFKKAALVVSYLDVPSAMRSNDFNFLHTPMGASNAFRDCPTWQRTLRPYAAMTSGYVAIPPGEAIAAVYEAAASLGRRVFQLGPRQPQGMPPTKPHLWTARNNITDAELAESYSNCHFVSGLRWVEGFEMPVVEGALCGARPICFDLPCYRQWFDGLACFVPHDAEKLPFALRQVLNSGVSLVSATERENLLRVFDWDRIASEVWGRVREAIKTKAEV